MNRLITILGPTATGKTTVAAMLARSIGGEVIGADSRQVYRGMDLGTGKDLDDYIIDGVKIPNHLIDIADPGEEYNVYRFQQDFRKAYTDIASKGKQAIMCGGTGMYLESVILDYLMTEVPADPVLRSELEKLSDEELIERLGSLKEVHNITDTGDRNRLIRAIEIAVTSSQPPAPSPQPLDIMHKVFGIDLPRNEIRSRITSRLKQRLDNGMVDEVSNLLNTGLQAEQLEFYGLEYKFLTQYVTGKIDHEEMFRLLNTAIHQFAKRQMTWFRRMEKKGINIEWIDGNLPLDMKVEIIKEKLGNEDR